MSGRERSATVGGSPRVSLSDGPVKRVSMGGGLTPSPLNMTALRTGGPSQRGTSLMKVDLDESKPVAEQLRDILSGQAVQRMG